MLWIEVRKKKTQKQSEGRKYLLSLFCYKYCNYLSIFSFVFKFVFLLTVFVSKKKCTPKKKKKKKE